MKLVERKSFMMLKIIVILQLLKFSLLTEVNVTIVNAPFNECNDDYWTGVSFYFNGEVVEKEIDDVCGKGDESEKRFTVHLKNATEIQKGNLELQLMEAKTDRHPSISMGLWHVERIVLESSEFKAVIGIGRQISPSRFYTIQSYDSVIKKPRFMIEQTMQDMAVIRAEYDTTPAYGFRTLILKKLPKEDDYQFKAHDKTKDLKRYQDAAVSSFRIKAIFHYFLNYKFENIEEIENFWRVSNFASVYENPKVVDYWHEDEWFGAQRLQGLNPYLIKLISDIPSSFRLKRSKVESLIGGEKLSDAFAANKIFLADVETLDNLDEDDIWAPQALFYLNGKKLLPIAIQLTRTDSAEDVFYREDSLAWILAKIYYNCAESVDLSIVRHLGHAHVFIEQFGVAINRFLSPNHPIRKMMKPHFYATFGTNYVAYFTFMKRGEIVDNMLQGKTKVAYKVFNKAMENVDYNTVNPVLDIERRQVGEDKIPVFPVRDRGLDIYNVLKKFVTGIVDNYYDNDNDVVVDEELKNFRYDLSLSTRYHGAGIKNLPGSDMTGEIRKVDLVNILTTILYQATAGHSVVNDGNYEQTALPLNYPGLLRKPPPKASNVSHIDEKFVVECFPDKKFVFKAGLISKSVATTVGTPLGQVENQLLHSPNDQEVYRKLQRDLKRLKDASSKYENMDERYPYTFLDVDRVKNSIRG